MTRGTAMKPLPSLWQAARAVDRARRTGAALPGPLHLTLPWPVPSAAGILWTMLYCPIDLDERSSAYRLGIPTYRISFRADFGSFAELRACAPSDFGLPEGADPWLGEVCDAPERAARRARLLDLYLLAVPSFAAEPTAIFNDVKSAAVEIAALLPDVVEPPLMPCYEHAFKRFFTWLKLAAP